MQIKIIEENHLEHFAFLPKKTGCSVTKINDITVINCGLQSSMFNIVYGAPKDFSKFDDIKWLKEVFKGQPFAWWVPPRMHNPALTKVLLDNGLTIETVEHAMICDLAHVPEFQQKTDLDIKPVKDRITLTHFMSVLEPYDSAVGKFYEKVDDELLRLQERLFVGYEKEKAVIIGILFVNETTAGIFSLLTKEGVRGKGYGTDMMSFLLEAAKKMGCKYVTLSASSDSGYRIYERLGFRKIGEFECFEYRGN